MHIHNLVIVLEENPNTSWKSEVDWLSKHFKVLYSWTDKLDICICYFELMYRVQKSAFKEASKNY